MKEIKFRAWDTNRKEMLNGITLWTTNQKDYFIGKVIMQYTGLEDKQGNEIYEGDIISIKRGWKYLWKVRLYNYKWEAVCLQAPNTCQNFKQVSKWRSVEVVGNIYSNPELIKEA